MTADLARKMYILLIRRWRHAASRLIIAPR